MSLGVVFKGPEGIVLAADSRVTLTAQIPNSKLLIPATFDNARKLLRVNGQSWVGAVTYGAGAIGQKESRTAHSYLPEFEQELKAIGEERLSVEDFAKALSAFYLRQWTAEMPQDYKDQAMNFLVAGYDEGSAYGKVFEIQIPYKPEPFEQHKDTFGIIWGGQKEITERLINGFDAALIDCVREFTGITEDQAAKLQQTLRTSVGLRIPYQFLPLQDCVDLSIFLVRATITLQTWYVGVRGVGGSIDVATITRTDGFVPIQQKEVSGERVDWGRGKRQFDRPSDGGE